MHCKYTTSIFICTQPLNILSPSISSSVGTLNSELLKATFEPHRIPASCHSKSLGINSELDVRAQFQIKVKEQSVSGGEIVPVGKNAEAMRAEFRKNPIVQALASDDENKFQRATKATLVEDDDELLKLFLSSSSYNTDEKLAQEVDKYKLMMCDFQGKGDELNSKASKARTEYFKKKCDKVSQCLS
jgi:hypothetical protein